MGEFVPELQLLYHTPNGAKRKNGAALKRQGLLAGVPDLCLPVTGNGYGSLYIELKTETGKLSKEQKKVCMELTRFGNIAVVCRTEEEAKKAIREHIWNTTKKDVTRCEQSIKIFDKCEESPWMQCKYCVHKGE